MKKRTTALLLMLHKSVSGGIKQIPLHCFHHCIFLYITLYIYHRLMGFKLLYTHDTCQKRNNNFYAVILFKHVDSCDSVTVRVERTRRRDRALRAPAPASSSGSSGKVTDRKGTALTFIKFIEIFTNG